MSDNDQRLLARFDKNVAEEIQIRATKWKTETYIDIRVWFKAEPGDDGDIRPTTKGLRFNAELLPDLRRAIDEAIREIGGDLEAEVVQDGPETTR